MQSTLRTVVSVATLVGIAMYLVLSNPVGPAGAGSVPQFCSTGTSPHISFDGSGQATPYPSTITVSGLAGTITKVTVSINSLNRPDTPPFGGLTDDLDLMLVAPGVSQTRALIMSDAGSDAAVLTNVSFTLDDTGVSGPLPDNAALVNGSIYQPANYEATVDPFDSPAPSASGIGSALSVFNTLDPNGTWSLFIMDDTFDGTPQGSIGSWCLTFTLQAPLESPTPTSTATATRTATATATATITPTATASATATISPTATVSPTITETPTITLTPTVTLTPTETLTPTATSTQTQTPTQSPTATATSTSTLTPTTTSTPTMSPTASTTLTPTVTSTLTNTPVATATRTPTNTAVPGIDLTISKSANPNPVGSGQRLTYTLVVSNSGQFATAAHKVRDPVPAGTSLAIAGTNCYVLAGAVWCNVPYLPRGGTATFTFSVRVDVAGGTITNTAFEDWDKQVAENNESNNTATVQTTVGP